MSISAKIASSYFKAFKSVALIANLCVLNKENNRTAEDVQRAMVNILFPAVKHEEIWEAFQDFEFEQLPETIWQFSRERYFWAKDQWPNLSDRITTIWALQDFGLLDKNIDIVTVVSVADKARRNFV